MIGFLDKAIVVGAVCLAPAIALAETGLVDAAPRTAGGPGRENAILQLAQELPPPASRPGGPAAEPTPEPDLWHRETLTGNWGACGPACRMPA